jgi:hypothetical protein
MIAHPCPPPRDLKVPILMGICPFFSGFAHFYAHRKFLPIKCPFSENLDKRGKLTKFKVKLP